MYAYSFERQGNHPVLASVRQTAANQILMTYDTPADPASAVRPSNYWIRGNAGPNGAATLNMGDALSAANAFRPEDAAIMPADTSGMHFILTLRNPIPSRTLYVVLPCFVNAVGATGFTGANWGPYSMNMFIGM